MNRQYKKAAISGLGMQACLSLCVVLPSCGYRHISDTRLIEGFMAHERDFDRLREMATADTAYAVVSPKRVTLSESGLQQSQTGVASIPIPPPRYSEYTRLFRQLALEDGIIRDERTVWFAVEARSWSNGSVTKGYVYSLDELGPVVNDLDAYVPAQTHDSRRPRFLVFRPFRPHWYLYELSDG